MDEQKKADLTKVQPGRQKHSQFENLENEIDEDMIGGADETDYVAKKSKGG